MADPWLLSLPALMMRSTSCASILRLPVPNQVKLPTWTQSDEWRLFWRQPPCNHQSECQNLRFRTPSKWHLEIIVEHAQFILMPPFTSMHAPVI